MNVLRGGALTALTFQVALGCVGSDPSPVPGAPVDTLSDGGAGDGAPDPTVVGQVPEKGIFVSSSLGREDADGSMQRPLGKIATAITVARTKPGTPVNVCAEEYTEAVTLVDGVTLFGYFDCSNREGWRRVKDKRAVIAAPTSPAVLAEGLTWSARFEGFEIKAPDFTELPPPNTEAASSVGVLIRGTRNLSLSEVTIRGGKGQDGLPGGEPPEGNTDTKQKQNGVPARAQAACTQDDANCVLSARTYGSAGGTSQCAQGTSGGPGGRGGDAPLSNNQGTLESIPSDDAHGKALTSMTTITAMGAPPTTNATDTPGSTGRAGTPGALGEHGVWRFTPGGFVPGNGTPGGIGAPGQGGGGGGGTTGWFTAQGGWGSSPPVGRSFGAAGAGGGAGGCGGLPGKGGSGGGASIGLFVVESIVEIDNARIESKKGGQAGKGASGTLGTAGGLGGPGKWVSGDARPQAPYGTRGGNGGNGGAAGLSGHGAPGPSIALAFSGTRPKLTNAELITGDAGDGYQAISRESQTLPAVVGTAKQEHQF